MMDLPAINSMLDNNPSLSLASNRTLKPWYRSKGSRPRLLMQIQKVQKKLEISFNFRIDKRIELVKFSILLWDKILTVTNYKKQRNIQGVLCCYG